uniref:(northern house mosquito) hypothetical protein n=1 Tax=Culex pipiens TaxID=7175 RepID=A0A8D8NP64_CULPI
MYFRFCILYMQITRIGIWTVLALPSFGDPFLRRLAMREVPQLESTSPALKNVCINRIQTLFRTSEPLSNGQRSSAYIVCSNSIPNYANPKDGGSNPDSGDFDFSFMFRVSRLIFPILSR